MADLTLPLDDAVQRDEPDAPDVVLALVFSELRQLAHAEDARRATGPHAPGSFANRAHFFGAAAEAMRRILIDRARRKLAARHAAAAEHLDVDGIEIAAPVEKDDELLAAHEALDALSLHDPRKAQLVGLRYFVRLTVEQVAKVLDISVAPAKRDWTYARTWPYGALSTP